MARYKKGGSSSLTNKDRTSLESLIRRYLEKTDELEDKEGKVLKQMELMQSAVASLQGWNQKRDSRPTSEPVHVNVRDIEEETKKIREETKRLQKEVRQKIEDNKKLQDRLDQKRMIERKLMERMASEDFAADRETERKREPGPATYSEYLPSAPFEPTDRFTRNDDPAIANDPRVKFFQDKIRQLEQMEYDLMRESEEDARVSKEKREHLREKIEMLEWETEIDRQLVKSLKRMYGNEQTVTR